MSGFFHGLFQLPYGLRHSGANPTSLRRFVYPRDVIIFGGLAHVDPLLQNLPSLAGFTFATALLQS